jgi:putative exosortase-associated protein (TIGR04073 family)
MKSTLGRVLALFGFIAMLSLMPQASQAQVNEDVYRENTDIQKMFHKLGRGVSNVLLGWVEIPKNIAREWRNTEPFTGTIVGLIKGVGWAVARTLSGVYEVISFPFPVPRDYQPLMYPEFVMPSVWGERLPIYQDEFLGASAGETRAIDPATNRTTGGRSY